MCKIIVSEAVFNKKKNVKSVKTIELGNGVHATFVCEEKDIELPLENIVSLLFGELSLFEQNIELNNRFCLSECGRRHNPEAMGLEKAYITLDNGELVLVTLSRVKYDEKLRPRFFWEVATE